MTLPPRYAHATFDAYEPQTASQREALGAAQAFARELREVGPARKLWARLTRSRALPYRGVYLVGPVGTGKTHLMAALYHALSPATPCAFLPTQRLLATTETPDAFAARIARDFRVLLLDEVEIDDPASEVRLVRTFKALDAAGVLLGATSNVEPEQFLSRAYGGDRFRRFLMEEFREGYRVILVDGEDYRARMHKPGRAWIGEPDAARARLDAAYASDERPKQRVAFADFLDRSLRTPHDRFVAELASADALYLDGIRLRGTDDALRLLKVVDDLYTRPDAPTLYFTSDREPHAWFAPGDDASELERGIAHKFDRTLSRLAAMAQIERV
jgi:cell division protein ZapE